MPLVILLHGYSADGAIQELYFQLQPLAEQRGFLYVHPDGTKDQLNQRFWNATNACCGFNSDVDDVAYLTAIINETSTKYTVDPKRIYLMGHSNGGFMSYRMACERADLVAAVVSLAGATFADAADCAPSEPVSVLQVHGMGDQVILYPGGEIFGRSYPSAQQTVAEWATYNGCSTTPPDPAAGTATLDVDTGVAGIDTTETAAAGCPTGIDAKLWSVRDASHIPSLAADFSGRAVDFLFAHAKA